MKLIKNILSVFLLFVFLASISGIRIVHHDCHEYDSGNSFSLFNFKINNSHSGNCEHDNCNAFSGECHCFVTSAMFSPQVSINKQNFSIEKNVSQTLTIVSINKLFYLLYNPNFKVKEIYRISINKPKSILTRLSVFIL